MSICYIIILSYKNIHLSISSVQFSRSVVSDSFTIISQLLIYLLAILFQFSLEYEYQENNLVLLRRKDVKKSASFEMLISLW